MNRIVDCGGGVRLERTVPCRMSDGVVLYADHYYPPGSQPQPTLLMRQPYGADIASTVVYAHPAWFARQGFNVVIQDVRGRGKSEGAFYPFRHEARDGAETIAAIRKRPECNGKVGMYGFSYHGMTQLLAAAEQPEGLLCISPAMTAHDLFHGWFYSNGALRLASTLGWGLQMLKEDARRLGLAVASAMLESAWANLPAQYLATPVAEHPVFKVAELPTYLSDWIEHSNQGPFWTAMDLSKRVDQVCIPALHIAGWFDTYLQGSVDGFDALRAHSGTAHARNNQYLLVGPWVHIPWGDRAGGAPLGSEALYDTDALLLRWMNHWLKDSGDFSGEPRIRHYAMGSGVWSKAQTFAQPSLTLHLHSGGRANSRKGDGTLELQHPHADQPPDIFIYDPEVPVPAPGGLACLSGPLDQAQTELGNNLLVFTGSPLENPLHIFGAAEIAVYVSTSTAYADLVVKLVCARPAGEAQFVCIGVARSSHLFREEYAADTTYLWRFSLDPTSFAFAAGDCIRVEVAGSAYPLFDRNSGSPTEARLANPWNWCRSTHTVYHDAERPSRIVLPVLSSEAA